MYTRVESRFWQDEIMRRVSGDARYLMLYLLTSPHRNMLGLYFLPSPYACFDLGWDEQRFNKVLQELLDTGRIKYDQINHVVLVANYLKHNPLENPNQVKKAIDKLNALPETPLFQDLYDILQQFNKEYLKPLKERLRERLAKPVYSKQDTVTVTGTGTGFNKHMRACNADADQDAEQNVQGENLATTGKPLSTGTTGNGEIVMGETPQEEPVRAKKEKQNHEYTSEFEEFWEVYPKKLEKRAAFKCWKTRLREGIAPSDLITAAKNYAAVMQGKDQKYIKYAKTFLGPNRPFEDYIRPPTEQNMNVPKAWHILKGYLNEENEGGLQ